MGGRGSSSAAGGNLITDESTNFGAPGTYELYRAGNLDAPNDMIFLSASLGETLAYARSSSVNTMERYQIDIKNPLIVSEDTDRNNVIAAWKALHPGEDPKIKTSGLPAKQWQRMDKQNAKALESSPYDAIIYKKANGRHEVQIPKSSASKLKMDKSIKYPNMVYNSENRWFSDGSEYKYTKGKGWKLIGEQNKVSPLTGRKYKLPKFIKE